MDLLIVSKTAGTGIDFVVNGRTRIYGKTLGDVREEYPDAEEMTLADWCSWKAAQQRTPIIWEDTTEERYYDLLGAVLPAYMGTGGFLVGEPWDHDALSGQPRYQAFRQIGDLYVVASRPMTVTEFKAAV